MKNFYAILFLIICFNAQSQPSFSQKTKDSLITLWNNTSQHDSNRLNAIKQIAWNGYLFTKPDSAVVFAQMQYDFAKKKASSVSSDRKLYVKHMADALNTMGVSAYFRGEYEDALENYSRSLQLKEEIGDKKGTAASLGNIGLILINQADYTHAIEYYTKSLKINEEIKNDKGIAATLNNIGNIYYAQKDYSRALDYYTRSLEIREKLNLKQDIATSYNNIGIIYSEQKDYDKAIEYYQKSLTIREEMGDKQGVATSHNNIGLLYKFKEDYKNAEIQLNKSLQIRREIGDKRGISTSLIGLSGVFIQNNNFSKALSSSIEALELAKQLGIATQIKDASYNLFLIYQENKQFNYALEMHLLYTQYKDSIANEEATKEVIRQEFKYNYEKQSAIDSIENAKSQVIKDAQIAKQQADLKAKRNQQYGLYGGLALVLIFSGFVFNRYKVTFKQKEIIAHTNEELNQINEELAIQRDELEIQRNKVQLKNNEIIASINYAQRIQDALLKGNEQETSLINEHFILFKPKDIVSGDFYWALVKKETINQQEITHLYLAAVDCTGHGVPGAFLTLLGTSFLNEINSVNEILSPSEILEQLRSKIVEELSKDGTTKDGMDISLIKLNLSTLEMEWAGANNPLYILRKDVISMANDEDIEIVKPDKQPIGYFIKPQPFTNYKFQMNRGDVLYLFSDGFADQFGGENGRKLGYRNFRKKIAEVAKQNIHDQKYILDNFFTEWKGNHSQIDDVCIIGVKI